MVRPVPELVRQVFLVGDDTRVHGTGDGTFDHRNHVAVSTREVKRLHLPLVHDQFFYCPGDEIRVHVLWFLFLVVLLNLVHAADREPLEADDDASFAEQNFDDDQSENNEDF